MSYQWCRAIEDNATEGHSYCASEGPRSLGFDRAMTTEGNDCVHATYSTTSLNNLLMYSSKHAAFTMVATAAPAGNIRTTATWRWGNANARLSIRARGCGIHAMAHL